MLHPLLLLLRKMHTLYPGLFYLIIRHEKKILKKNLKYLERTNCFAVVLLFSLLKTGY